MVGVQCICVMYMSLYCVDALSTVAIGAGIPNDGPSTSSES